ncbi:MAG: glycoside hydrolase family 16 protein [Bacteroidales bacterium]|jgi:beta-glucanase (GH16 family)|nr:glycoside hydrolase family 16 protein [Bacteroidales bacterium]
MKTYIKLGSIVFFLLNTFCLNAFSQIEKLCDNGYSPIETVTQSMPCDYNPYMIIFEDNFDGNSLDESKWDILGGVIRDFDFEMTKAFLTRDNVVVEDGLLKLITKRENLTNVLHYTETWEEEDMVYDDFEFTSGEIISKARFPINGRFEARIKIPSTQGLWPAFWMFHGILDSETGDYTEYSEIDIFEVLNRTNTDKEYTTNIWHVYNGEDRIDCQRNHGNAFIDGNFHIFTLTWDEDKIEYYVDSTLIRRTPYYTSMSRASRIARYCGQINQGIGYYKTKAFPREAMHILFGIAVMHTDTIGSYYITPYPTTPFPAQMEVDYVRVYQRKSCTDTVTVNNDIDTTENISYQSITGNIVNMTCAINIPTGYSLRVKASNKITFGNGFSLHVADGAVFHASTDANLCNSGRVAAE